MANRPKSTGEENEYHVIGVRMRVVGIGNLKLQLIDLDDVQVVDLEAIAMTPTTRFEPTKLADFQSQRIRLHGYLTEINETFTISKIILFAKPVAVEYPM